MGYTLVLRQRLTVIVNRWELCLLGSEETSETLGLVQQKRLSLREAIRCERPDGAEAFSLRARNILELRGRYDVTRDGDLLGQLSKSFGRSLLRSTFDLDVAGTAYTLTERSLGLALTRRLLGELLPFWPFPIQFDILDIDGNRVGRIDRRFRIRDEYVAHVDVENIPWEVAGAAMIAVDAFMNR